MVKPIPVSFHIGGLEIHTYGIGLAITFIFAVLVVLFNVIADVLYGLLDLRVTYS